MPGEPAEAARVRRSAPAIAGPHRRVFASLQTLGVRRRLRRADPDHDLRDGDPRRRRQPRRRRHRRDRHQRLAELLPRRRTTRRWLFYGDPDRRARRSSAAVAEARRGARRDGRASASRSTRSSAAISADARPTGEASPAAWLDEARSALGARSRTSPRRLATRAYVAADRDRARAHDRQGWWRDRRCSCRRSTSPRSSGRTSSSTQPAVTRLILLGALLVVLMNRGRRGCSATARVEIV